MWRSESFTSTDSYYVIYFLRRSLSQCIVNGPIRELGLPRVLNVIHWPCQLIRDTSKTVSKWEVKRDVLEILPILWRLEKDVTFGQDNRYL